MNLKEVRKLGIKYCEENNCKYTYISFNDTDKFYLSDKENNYTVFTVKNNGSLGAYLATKYAADFHKELKRRKSNRRKSYKEQAIRAYSRSYEEGDVTVD